MNTPKQQYKRLSLTRTKADNGLEVYSFDTVLLGDWLIKASLSNFDTIFVLMESIETGETCSGFFTDELKANDFINLKVYADK